MQDGSFISTGKDGFLKKFDENFVSIAEKQVSYFNWEKKLFIRESVTLITFFKCFELKPLILSQVIFLFYVFSFI